MFPLPDLKLMSVHGHAFGMTDLLPLTHTASAFNQILNDGAGLPEVGWELIMIVLLTMVYFAGGLLLYRKRRLSKV
ncbi:hypothetical protein D3C80_1542770 [compost metagenome]